MQHKSLLIIGLLIFSLLIQNTCLHGYAGKSAVLVSCAHCPFKQIHKPTTEDKTYRGISHAPAHLPMYVLDSSNTQPIFRLATLALPGPVVPNMYKNTAPDELLHPPQV